MRARVTCGNATKTVQLFILAEAAADGPVPGAMPGDAGGPRVRGAGCRGIASDAAQSGRPRRIPAAPGCPHHELSADQGGSVAPRRRSHGPARCPGLATAERSRQDLVRRMAGPAPSPGRRPGSRSSART